MALPSKQGLIHTVNFYDSRLVFCNDVGLSPDLSSFETSVFRQN